MTEDGKGDAPTREAARQERLEDVVREVAAKLAGVRARLSAADFDSLVRRIAERAVEAECRRR